MPDSESFDAFYARTVWNVTSQMHALAGEDSAADHAIREAYARAYQQWYEIAGYPDTEGWVLAVAREAYQRRRPETATPARDPRQTGHDPLSMPGMFRPAVVRSEPAGTGGDTTLAPPAPGGAGEQPGNWFNPVSETPGTADGAAGPGQARGIGGVFGGPAAAPGNAMATTQLAGDSPPPSQPAEPTGPLRPGRLGQVTGGGRRPLAMLVALVAILAVAAAAVAAYLVADHHGGGRSADGGAAHGKTTVHMLAAGQTGKLSTVPWSIVGTGWTLAEVSSAPATAPGSGTITTYLVDPEGGRYQIQASSPGAVPQLLAWSGDKQYALYAVPAGSAGAGVTYELLAVMTGTMTPLPLPKGVTAVGFSRPDGENILAVQQGAAAFHLQRYNLQGAFQAVFGTLPRKSAAQNWPAGGCGTECGALSSPDGQTDVWGVIGDQMQLVGNAGGLIRRLDVPNSGSPPSCVPLTWWDAATVLASCSVTGQPSASQLWLVPANGAAPSQLTGPSGSGSGQGVLTDAWQGPGAVYVTETSGAQCSGAASGPGGLTLLPVSGQALQQPVSIRGTTSNYASVVSVYHGQLLVLAQTSCPGTSSLLWLNPSTGATTTSLAGQPGQVGVLAAVGYGLGPAAIGPP